MCNPLFIKIDFSMSAVRCSVIDVKMIGRRDILCAGKDYN